MDTHLLDFQGFSQPLLFGPPIYQVLQSTAKYVLFNIEFIFFSWICCQRKIDWGIQKCSQHISKIKSKLRKTSSEFNYWYFHTFNVIFRMRRHDFWIDHSILPGTGSIWRNKLLVLTTWGKSQDCSYLWKMVYRNTAANANYTDPYFLRV